MSSQTGLLHQDLLILQQFRNGLSPEFNILDDQEQVVGMVGGTESGARQFLLGPREFDVLDADGRRLAHISDVRDFWRDTYEIMRGDGSMLAIVTRKLGFFSHRFSIELSTGEVFMVEGDFFGREFNVVDVDDEEIVAQASRERAGFAKALLGHDRYALYYLVGTSPDRRLALLGGMIALDLMRAKDASSTASYNST